MDIFQKTKELDLPKDEYVVVGGGILVALELLSWDDDIDITVTPQLFARYQAAGWRQEEWAGKPVLKHDVYDIGVGFGQWNLAELQADAMIIQDVPFMSLEKLLQWKRQMARPKDLRHITLIEQYLRGQQHAAR